ncbi:hypothetical protein [Janibacter cremeus]|uniref:PqqD family peptide modification chaperone n=1 Tax=Janibacter cremeus TaxID=1285192 RepID=A0A852VRN7_9MICO|nr:hypothetical protein [Janibacter cremeus]NYF98100.1 hypothetical protein [Janibacter cremeus]
MSDLAKEEVRHLDLVSMGCRWVLDVSDLDEVSAAQTAARWRRCIDLATAATTIVDDEPETIRATATQQPYDLSRELTRKGLMRLRGRVTLLHAAALADASGRAIALVAPSGGGKSTATSVLGRRLGYLSDETLVLLEDHGIAPHPKPPSLVVDPDDRWRKDEPAPDELDLGPTPGQARLARLLTLERDEDVTEPAIEPVGLIDQLLAVLPETSSTWLVPAGLDRLARAVTVGGPPARLRYAEVDTCHDLVREHLAAPETQAPTWEHLPPDEAERLRPDEAERRTVEQVRGGEPAISQESDDDLDGSDGLVRAPWSDAIAHDGEVLVLAGARPLRLAGAGATIWLAARNERTLDELTDVVVAELGDHPDSSALVRAAVVDLLDHGVLALA